MTYPSRRRPWETIRWHQCRPDDSERREELRTVEGDENSRRQGVPSGRPLEGTWEELFGNPGGVWIRPQVNKGSRFIYYCRGGDRGRNHVHKISKLDGYIVVRCFGATWYR